MALTLVEGDMMEYWMRHNQVEVQVEVENFLALTLA